MINLETYALVLKLIKNGFTPSQLKEAVNEYLDSHGIKVNSVDGGTYSDWTKGDD